VRVSAGLLFHHPNKKDPTFSKEVGFGRRVRGNANAVNILGGILIEKRDVTMISEEYPKRVPKWVIQGVLHNLNCKLIEEH